MDKKYVFHSSCYDKELLLKKIIILNDNDIDFKTIEKSSRTQFRAPLSGYFEVEIHIIEDDFENASRLLSPIDEI